jgi:hypothetical protein
MLECIEERDGGCDGEIQEHRSRSGATVSARCETHQRIHEVRTDKVHADVSSRYPGYDTPGSLPPADFDPTYAGESWDED